MFFLVILGVALTAEPLQLPHIMPVGYPAHCAQEAAAIEKVTVEFTVSPSDGSFRVKVKKSTNQCFNQPANQHVAKWGHAIVAAGNDSALPARGVITLTFNRDSSHNELDRAALKRIRESFHTIAESLRNKESPRKALKRLEKISDEYKTALPPSEVIVHSLLTAIAYHDLGQDEKALSILLETKQIQSEYGLPAALDADLNASITELENVIRKGR